MRNCFEGSAWLYGNNIDTDVILPGPYLIYHTAEELGQYAMIGIDSDFINKINKGDLIVAGFNFGCGSSREHAPLALKGAGIAAVIAESFSRIFFRNAINVGFPVLECHGIYETTKQGDLLSVDIKNGMINNKTSGHKYTAVGLPDFIIDIISKGGIVPYLKENLRNEV